MYMLYHLFYRKCENITAMTIILRETNTVITNLNKKTRALIAHLKMY